MLNRKKTTPKSASRSHRAGGKSVKAKTAPVRRRFIISSNAKKNPVKTETNGKAKSSTTSIAEAEKRLQNGHGNGTPAVAPTQPTADLTETIKTLLHLAQ